MEQSGGNAVFAIVELAVCVLMLVSMWKIYVKANEPGWKCLIPIYNVYTLFKFTWGNGWLFLLMCVPVVNIVVEIMVMHKLSKSFGKGVGYTLGLIFLSIIFLPILAFSDAEYIGPQ